MAKIKEKIYSVIAVVYEPVKSKVLALLAKYNISFDTGS